MDYGAAIVAADTVDVSPVQKRFDAFAQEQQRYTSTHGTVQAAVSDLRERRTLLVQLDLAQDEAIEEVACRLALEGQPRANPFAAYDVDAPFALKQLNYGEKATAIHTLVAMVHADTTLSAATQHAAQAAEAAARQMETALVPFDKLQTSLRTARAARQAAGKQWDKAFKALKRRTTVAHRSCRNGGRRLVECNSVKLAANTDWRRGKRRCSRALPGALRRCVAVQVMFRRI